MIMWKTVYGPQHQSQAVRMYQQVKRGRAQWHTDSELRIVTAPVTFLDPILIMTIKTTVVVTLKIDCSGIKRLLQY